MEITNKNSYGLGRKNTGKNSQSSYISIKLDRERLIGILEIDNVPVYYFLSEEDNDHHSLYLKGNHILTVWFDAW